MNRLVFISCFCFLFICSCADHSFHGIGEMTTEIRQIQPFDTLVIERNVAVSVIFENITHPYIEMTGGKKMIEHLQTTVHNRTLTIKQNSRLNWLRNYQKSTVYAILHTSPFSFLLYKTHTPLNFLNPLEGRKFRFEIKNGMGQIQLQLLCDTFELVLHNGSPDVILEGTANKAYIYSNGHGNIEARELLINHAAIHSRMTADIYVSVMHTLGASIEYLGNVYYRGTPQLLWLNQTHKGKLIKIDQ